MDINLALVSGLLALPPDLERLPDGSHRARLLVCVRSERRGRFDVLPVLVPPEVLSEPLASASGGVRVFVAGPMMRRCDPDPWQPPGRIELVADALCLPDFEDPASVCGSIR